MHPKKHHKQSNKVKIQLPKKRLKRNQKKRLKKNLKKRLKRNKKKKNKITTTTKKKMRKKNKMKTKNSCQIIKELEMIQKKATYRYIF